MEASLQLECRQGNVHWLHGAKLIGPSFERSEDQASFLLRLFCHLLIDHIPSEGITDVCQSLREFYEYYQPAESSRMYLPGVRAHEARRGVQLVRPMFTVDGD